MDLIAATRAEGHNGHICDHDKIISYVQYDENDHNGSYGILWVGIKYCQTGNQIIILQVRNLKYINISQTHHFITQAQNKPDICPVKVLMRIISVR